MIKTETIKKNYEFKTIFEKGRFIPGQNIVIHYVTNNKELNRVGIAISRKTGKSVVRNRLKRLFRESYTILEKDIKYGFNIIFVWKKTSKIEYATFNNIKDDMEKVLKKAGIL